MMRKQEKTARGTVGFSWPRFTTAEEREYELSARWGMVG